MNKRRMLGALAALCMVLGLAPAGTAAESAAPPTIKIKEITFDMLDSSWEGDASYLNAKDLPGFHKSTSDIAGEWDEPPTDGEACLLFDYHDDMYFRWVYFKGGEPKKGIMDGCKKRSAVYSDVKACSQNSQALNIGSNGSGGTRYFYTYRDHVFDAAWSKDEKYHWHACTAEGAGYACLGDPGAKMAEHSYGESGDARFTCTVCKYVDAAKKAGALASDKEAAANKEAAALVVKKINEIGTVEFIDAARLKIDAARTAYNALSSEQKKLVSNYAALKDAEDRFAALKAAAEKAAADKKAADGAMDKIKAIGVVSYTAECKSRIDSARTAYDALTSDQKKLVTNYSTLTDAEKKYADLKVEAEKAEAEKEETQPSGGTQPPKTAEEQPQSQQEKITVMKAPSSVKVKANKGKVTVTWKKIKKNKAGKKLLKQIRHIEVQAARDPNFKNIVTTKNVGKKKSKAVLKLARKTTYFIRVRYVGGDGVSKWSKTKKIKTK